MTGDADHEALAGVLHACRGQVLVSGYRSALYDELYADWARAGLRVRRSSANRPGHGGSVVTETVWSNWPLPAQQSLDQLWAVQAGDPCAVATTGTGLEPLRVQREAPLARVDASAGADTDHHDMGIGDT
jgi:hypothetical protein